jgi:hypothetical protein
MELGLMYVWCEILGLRSFGRPVWHMAIVVGAINIDRLGDSSSCATRYGRYPLDIEQYSGDVSHGFR